MAAGNPCRTADCTNGAEKDRAECSSCRWARRSSVASRVEPAARVLLIDIETSPSTAYVWGQKNPFISIDMFESFGGMLCFAAKWLGEKKVVFYSVHEHGHDAMVRAAHELLDEADAVMHYNGTSFDVPHLNREFLLAGLAPPAPFKQIDLLRAVRKRFRFVSNKLQHISTQLGLDGKASHEGFGLWTKCMAGDAAAWKRMEKYNRQDVVLLEDLYHKLLPWLPSHPNGLLYGGDGCPTCGSDKVHARGYAYTALSKFRQYHCQSCGSYFRSNKREAGVAIQAVAQ